MKLKQSQAYGCLIVDIQYVYVIVRMWEGGHWARSQHAELGTLCDCTCSLTALRLCKTVHVFLFSPAEE